MTDDPTYYGGTDAPLSPNQLKGGDPNVTGVERWISILAGGTIATWGARRGGALGVLAGIGGAGLIARGARGQDPIKRSFQPTPYERKVADEQGWSTAATAGAKVSIALPRDRVYAFYRDAANLPRFMEYLERIEPIDAKRALWVMREPGGGTRQWVSVTIEDVPGERIAWKTDADAEVQSTGWVEFRDGPQGRGTEVGVMIAYEPRYGQFGRVAAKAMRREAGIQSRKDLKRLKMLLETGEIATGQRFPGGPGEK